MANLADGMYAPPRKREPAKKNKAKQGLGTAPPTSSPGPPPPPPSYGQSGMVPSLTPPSPKPPDIASYLAGDTAYQQALRGGQRTLQDFLSDLKRQRSEASINFETTQQSLEADRERQLARMRDEFASRGLIHSGLFAKEQGTFQEQFLEQQKMLQQAQAQLLSDLLAQETNYKREQELAMERAKQEALARRAGRYSLT